MLASRSRGRLKKRRSKLEQLFPLTIKLTIPQGRTAADVLSPNRFWRRRLIMKSPKFLFLILPLVVLAGCYSAPVSRLDRAESVGNPQLKTTEGFAKDQRAPNEQNPVLTQVSLKQADQSQSIAEAMDRKILRDATLTLEVGAPAEAQRKITSIAESLGGFVVTSESKLQQTGDAKQELEVN